MINFLFFYFEFSKELRYRPISEVTSRHVISQSGGQASVCLQHGSESEYEAWDVTRLFWESTGEAIKGKISWKAKIYQGQDPYEISRKELIDDVDCWPDVTYINVGMYLLFAASPYTQEQLMNYKSLDCYQNFANGWGREVLCKKFGENRLLIGKVRFYNFC